MAAAVGQQQVELDAIGRVVRLAGVVAVAAELASAGLVAVGRYSTN